VKPQDVLRAALLDAARAIGASADEVTFTVGPTRDPSHGDFATNLAMVLAKREGRPPRGLAESLVAALKLPPGFARRVEIAGPGFINVHLEGSQLAAVLGDVLARGAAYGRSDAGRGRRVNVEFVSANPTGPLHRGTGGGRRSATPSRHCSSGRDGG
jgi:arginyl-tRNA synthetase